MTQISTPKSIEEWRAEWARQDAQQDLVNRAAALNPAMAERFARRFARLEHVDHPQYAGFWDGWSFGRITCDIRTKGGLRFAEGDWVLFSVSRSPLDFCGVTAYSVRGAINCSVPAGALRWWEHR